MYLFDAIQKMRDQSKIGEPFAVRFTKTNLSKKQGGEVRELKDVITKPVKNNAMRDQMIGFQLADGSLVNVYLLSMLQVRFGARGRFTNLTLER